MARGKKDTAEQIVNLLRQVEVGVANGRTLPQACREAEIVEQICWPSICRATE
jgi:putative transposase